MLENQSNTTHRFTWGESFRGMASTVMDDNKPDHGSQAVSSRSGGRVGTRFGSTQASFTPLPPAPISPPVIETQKLCPKCGTTKPSDEFKKDKRYADGRAKSCKACSREYARKYRFEHPDRVKASVDKYVERHRETIRARGRVFREQNPDYAQQYRRAHKNKYNELSKQYQKTHPRRVHAWIVAKQAKRAGELIQPERCEICRNRTALDMHHQDYLLPLDVNWLCRKCHTRVHLVVAELMASLTSSGSLLQPEL